MEDKQEEGNHGRMPCRCAILTVMRSRRSDFKRCISVQGNKVALDEACAKRLCPILNLRCQGNMMPERQIALRTTHAQRALSILAGPIRRAGKAQGTELDARYPMGDRSGATSNMQTTLCVQALLRYVAPVHG